MEIRSEDVIFTYRIGGAMGLIAILLSIGLAIFILVKTECRVDIVQKHAHRLSSSLGQLNVGSWVPNSMRYVGTQKILTKYVFFLSKIICT